MGMGSGLNRFRVRRRFNATGDPLGSLVCKPQNEPNLRNYGRLGGITLSIVLYVHPKKKKRKKMCVSGWRPREAR